MSILGFFLDNRWIFQESLIGAGSCVYVIRNEALGIFLRRFAHFWAALTKGKNANFLS
ncbi:hypothetical protein EDD55_103308 [Varunaivibrio sulfuroxidans]|uniref:Uncharacterized protein n=1 Tax=Varunaivibrio sulfuroxidans TaxID=1773489 RepID=A0A4R3JEM7_9PROT|nr:hypothetical protein EDD55_103308 [Varunaivibrio sulfuroxidans]